MTDVQFRFRKGAGSNLDVLFGTVTLKPTLAHSRGTSMVLPAPSTWDIINGEVLATNVQPTPEPVGGVLEWGYEVTVKDRHGKSYSFLVGVPDSTTAVEFVSLPRYFETKPPLFGQGPKGDAGEAATISVGTVTSGTTAKVTNSGTSSDAKLDFVLPQGPKGDKGDGVFFEDKLFTDAPTTYRDGTTYTNGNKSSGWPEDFLTVITQKRTWGRTVQTIMSVNKNFHGVRTDQSGVWTPIKMVAYADPVTSTANGLMTSADKVKLDGLGTLEYISKTANDPPSSYPSGTTVGLFRTTDGWPAIEGSSQPFLTVRTDKPRGYDTAIQWASSYNASNVSNLEDAPVLFRQGKTSGEWSAWVEIATTRSVSKGLGVVTPEQFGAKGDGIADDSDALISALESAKGATIYLNGKYRITKTITNGGQDVSLVASNSAKIFSESQTFNLVELKSTAPEIVKNLSSSQTLGGNGWVLNNVTGVEPGMLAYVKSSKSWYYDPRPEATDARKSEVHRVREIVGNKVYFENTANDGYNTLNEAVTITFIKPVRVAISGLNVQAKLPSYSSSTPWCMGIRIYNAAETYLENVSVSGAAYTGIWLVHCYNSKVIGGTITDANYTATGYGIQTSGCANTLVFGAEFYGCRRAVDFSGANIISRNNVVAYCKSLGGGKDSAGRAWGWEESGLVGGINYGFGSHGAADHSIYANNITVDTHMPYSVRGRDETIINNRHYGRTRGGFVSLTSGAIVHIEGNIVGSAYEGKDQNAYDGAGSMPNRRPDRFLTVHPSYDTNSYNTTTIKNNTAYVLDTFIYFANGNTFNGPTDISGNTVVYQGDGVFLKNAGAIEASNYRWTVGPNSINRTSGTNSGLTLTENVNLTGAKVIDYTISGATP